MATTSSNIRRELRDAGIATTAINAAWPEWWSAEAETSLSASTELRYTLARRLGLSPTSLMEGRPKFIWRDQAKFKNLSDEVEEAQAALASFGVAVARSLVRCTEPSEYVLSPYPEVIRRSILLEQSGVNTADLVYLAWAIGIPVVQLAVFPLDQKRMHAMTVRVDDGRHAILLGRQNSHPAPYAFVIAHELAHIALGHTEGAAAVVDLQDPLAAGYSDDEEASADTFALRLLTDRGTPHVLPETEGYSSGGLAREALRVGELERIDPGVLLMCFGWSTQDWRMTNAALRLIPPHSIDMARWFNANALGQMDLDQVDDDTARYIARVLGQ